MLFGNDIFVMGLIILSSTVSFQFLQFFVAVTPNRKCVQCKSHLFG